MLCYVWFGSINLNHVARDVGKYWSRTYVEHIEVYFIMFYDKQSVLDHIQDSIAVRYINYKNKIYIYSILDHIIWKTNHYCLKHTIANASTGMQGPLLQVFFEDWILKQWSDSINMIQRKGCDTLALWMMNNTCTCPPPKKNWILYDDLT